MRFLRNAILQFFLVVVTLGVVEAVSYFSTRAFPHLLPFALAQKWETNPPWAQLSDRDVMFARFLTRHRLPDHAVVVDLLDSQTRAQEFYNDGRVSRLRTLISHRKPYQIYLNGFDVKTFETADSFWAGLGLASKDRKLIVTFGGSTTAGAWNWPFFLSQYLDRKWPGEYVVLNMGQPGFITYQTGVLAERLLQARLNDLAISPTAVLSLEGVNDAAVPLFGIINKALDQPGCVLDQCASLSGVTNPAKVHGRGFNALNKNQSPQETETISDRFIKGVIKTLPYASAITLWAIRPKEQARKKGGNISDASKRYPLWLKNAFRDEGELRKFTPSKQLIDAIIEHYQQGVDRLERVYAPRKIPVLHYLQPVLLAEYTEIADKRLAIWRDRDNFRPTLEYFIAVSNSTVPRLRHPTIIEFSPIYSAFRDFVSRQDSCCHKDLSPILRDPRKLGGDTYSADAIHYGSDRGAKEIARHIFEDFAQKIVGEVHKAPRLSGEDLLDRIFTNLRPDMSEHVVKSSFFPGVALFFDRGNSLEFQPEGGAVLRIDHRGASFPPEGRSNNGFVRSVEDLSIVGFPAGPLKAHVVIRKPAKNPAKRFFLILGSARHWGRYYSECIPSEEWSVCSVELPEFDGRETVDVRMLGNGSGEREGTHVLGFALESVESRSNRVQ
jgi:hypothetical protein